MSSLDLWQQQQQQRGLEPPTRMRVLPACLPLRKKKLSSTLSESLGASRACQGRIVLPHATVSCPLREASSELSALSRTRNIAGWWDQV